LILAMLLAACLANAKPVYQFHTLSGGVRTAYEVIDNQYAVLDAQGAGEFYDISGAGTFGDLVATVSGKGPSARLVVMKSGVPASVPLVLGSEVILHTIVGFNAADVASVAGVSEVTPFLSDSSLWIAKVNGLGTAVSLLDDLAKQPGVVFVEPTLGSVVQKKLVPNDPILTNQWHLLNTGQNGADPRVHINVLSTWDTYRGNGIDVGVVDDGLQVLHPDLIGNANTVIDYDYLFFDNDPSPLAGESHGTAVGGLIGAVGQNSLGVVGVAYECNLSGLKILGNGSAFSGDSQIASALTHSNSVIEVKNNSWGYPTTFPQFNFNFPPQYVREVGTLTRAAIEDSVVNGRSGLGTIQLFAAGNDGDVNDDVNLAELANSRETITIGAINHDGSIAAYSTGGAAVVA